VLTSGIRVLSNFTPIYGVDLVLKTGSGDASEMSSSVSAVSPVRKF